MSYPINLEVRGKKCVVLGGGKVAYRKICGLLAANAEIILISPEICDEIKQLIECGKIKYQNKKYKKGELPEGILLIAATNDKKINEEASEEATEKKMLVNVATTNEKIDAEKNFTVPSVIRRGDLMITISTNGRAPGLSKFIREYLEEEVIEKFAKELPKISEEREKIKKDVSKI